MPQGEPWPVPFVIDFHNLALDAVVVFCISIFLAVMINAEAQAWMATTLGDTRPDTKDRFHFNFLRHLGILGTISFFVGGFGWPKQVDIDSSRFSYPRLYTFFSRLAGPIANLLLAGIAGSMVIFGKFIDLDPQVFFMVIGVNVTTAVYNLLPIPPLLGGVVITSFIPERFQELEKLIAHLGPFVIIALFLLERTSQSGIVSPYLNPIVVAVFEFIKG
jgi:Zn-dependent protease